MKSPSSHYVVVGGFVLAMLVAFLTAVAVLMGNIGGKDYYTTIFDNVMGIRLGTAVTYNGYPIGQVEKITPSTRKENAFDILLSVEEDWPIPEDSVARIASAGILSAAQLDIKGGTSSTLLPPDSNIPAGAASSLTALVGDATEQLEWLIKDGLMPFITNLNQKVTTVGGALEKDMPVILSGIRNATQYMEVISQRLGEDGVTPENLKNVQVIISNLAAISSNLKETQGKLDSVLGNVNTVIGENRAPINATLKDLQYSAQVLSRHIDSLAYNLEASSRNFNEFSRQIRDNPGVLIGGTTGGSDGPGRR